ncbi:MAG TPA: hypothetical protein VNM45_12315 [Bacillus sp. (in: firmicutes)]|nr:hypothetical protein [Bacillus sp. (in: firmicutes)]
MTMKYLYILVLFLFCGSISTARFTYAHELDDDDSPISFNLEMLSWEKVDRIIPNKTKFTVIDVETGKQFRVQRRAGSKHADVQPLTNEDTQIMKDIYNGKWSWKRRAALVLIGDQLIAGSMHGMPHGAGALQNGFPGHFCIHFSGSTTHRSKNPDFSHELMILKAAGKLAEHMDGAEPDEVIEVFAESINQRDSALLRLATSKIGQARLEKVVKAIEYIALGDSYIASWKSGEGILLIELPVEAEMYRKDIGRERKTIHFILRKDGMIDRWTIDSQSLYEQLS